MNAVLMSLPPVSAITRATLPANWLRADSRISPAEGGVGFVPEENLVARADRLLFSTDPSVGWLDVAAWPHVLRLARLFGRID